MTSRNLSGHKITQISGKVSVGNSTSTALTASSTYTGVGEEVYGYSTITTIMDSDQDGTLFLELSTDNINWDRSKEITLDTALVSGSVHTLEVVSRWFRVRYVNGSTDQTHFRLQTIYHPTRSGFLSSSPDEQISKVNDAQIVRVSNDPYLDLSRTLYRDKSAVHKFGANLATPTGERDIWTYGATDQGDIDYNWLQSVSAVRIKSGGNAADDTAGAGAQTIVVEGLNANFAEQSSTITTAGTSASSATPETYIRITRASVANVGTYTGANTGNIVIETTGGTVVGEILAGSGQTQLSMYTVPAGHTAYLRHAHCSVSTSANKESTITMYQRRNADDTTTPFTGKRIVHVWEAVSGVADLNFFSLPAFPEKTDIWFTSKGSTSVVSITYDLIVVKGDTVTIPQ